MNRTKIVLGFILLIYPVFSSNNEDTDDFIATNQWQVIKEGQKIPKGLHVRINLATGLKEAKLLEETPEDKSRALLSIENEPEIGTKAHLKDALKNIKSDDVLNPDSLKQIKDRFRNYDELKESLGGLTPKLDSEIIHELVDTYKGTVNISDKLQIIEAMDYLAHQHDNALEFVKLDCFKQLIYPNINATEPELRRKSLTLLSSLIQNNNKPKIHTLETGGLPILLRIISFDPDKSVRNVAVTALSSLLRSFPAAQQHFLDNGGFSVISNIFEGDNVKIQTKIATMITDLIIEHDYAKGDAQLNQYYSNHELRKQVLEKDWCENLNKLLARLVAVDQDDHDSLEKGLVALHTVHKDCSTKYDRFLVSKLKNYYETLAQDDEFFLDLKQLCDNILQTTTVRSEL